MGVVPTPPFSPTFNLPRVRFRPPLLWVPWRNVAMFLTRFHLKRFLCTEVKTKFWNFNFYLQKSVWEFSACLDWVINLMYKFLLFIYIFIFLDITVFIFDECIGCEMRFLSHFLWLMLFSPMYVLLEFIIEEIIADASKANIAGAFDWSYLYTWS